MIRLVSPPAFPLIMISVGLIAEAIGDFVLSHGHALNRLRTVHKHSLAYGHRELVGGVFKPGAPADKGKTKRLGKIERLEPAHPARRTVPGTTHCNIRW